MALVTCTECGAEMSSEALACPRCGKPNASAIHKKQNGAQSMGCLLMVLALPAALFMGPLAAVMFVVGLVLILLNTRVR